MKKKWKRVGDTEREKCKGNRKEAIRCKKDKENREDNKRNA